MRQEITCIRKGSDNRDCRVMYGTFAHIVPGIRASYWEDSRSESDDSGDSRRMRVVTTRQDRHNLCHQPPPRKDHASPRRRRWTRIYSHEEHLWMKAFSRRRGEDGWVLSEILRSLSVVFVVGWRGPSVVVVGGRGCCGDLDVS